MADQDRIIVVREQVATIVTGGIAGPLIPLTVAGIPSGIPATKIADGAVDNTEFSYLDGVTSSIQTQLDGKAASVHQHSGADITSGTVAPARLGAGAPTSSKLLDGGGNWRSLSSADLPAGLSSGVGYGQTAPSAFALGLYGYGAVADSTQPGVTCGGTAAGGSVIYNCPSAKTHNFLINGVLNMCIGSALGSTVDGNWVIGKYGNPSAIGSVTGVCGSGSSIYYNAPTGGGHSIRINNTVVALVQSALISLSAPVTLGNSYTATAGSNQIVGTASGVQLNAPTGSAIVLSTNGTSRLNVSGTVATFTVPVVTPTATPASATATGTAGQWAWDANYIYICVATNTWRRVAHATW